MLLFTWVSEAAWENRSKTSLLAGDCWICFYSIAGTWVEGTEVESQLMSNCAEQEEHLKLGVLGFVAFRFVF